MARERMRADRALAEIGDVAFCYYYLISLYGNLRLICSDCVLMVRRNPAEAFSGIQELREMFEEVVGETEAIMN